MSVAGPNSPNSPVPPGPEQISRDSPANPQGVAGLISLRQVSIQFEGHQVLHAIDLEVHRGQTVCVIGESGCGKTVLLKLIIGLLRPSVGRVLFNGKMLVDLPEKELVRERLHLGFLFQGAALFDSLTVRENVAFGLQGQKRSREEIEEIVSQRLREVGLTVDILEKKPAELSGGMKNARPVRALALDPEVMLYDEPTTGLDPIMTDVINELILQTRKQRPITSIVVTHELRTVDKVADRVVMLYPTSRLTPGENQIIYDGTPEEMHGCSDPRVRNFIEGKAGDRLKDM